MVKQVKAGSIVISPPLAGILRVQYVVEEDGSDIAVETLSQTRDFNKDIPTDANDAVNADFAVKYPA